jgi:type II secretory pathway component PulF
MINLMNRVDRFIYKLTLSANDRIELYDNFRQYTLDGLPALEIFNKLIDNYTRRGKKPKNPMGRVLTECRDNLSAGYSLAQSLREWIPDQELSIIESCDTAGKVAEGFLNAMLIADGTHRIVSAVRGSLMITTYMLSLGLGILALFCILLVPVLKQTVPLNQWSDSQLMVYYLYIGITEYSYIFVLFILILSYMVYKSLSNWSGHIRLYFDKIPPYSVYSRLQGATFIMNVNAMISAGITMEDALSKMVDSCQSRWLGERLEATLQQIANGEPNLGSALDVTGFDFPGEEAIIKMQSLFETTNREGSLKRFAEKWLDKTIKGVEQTSERMRIASMLGCGVGISFLIIIMFDLIQRAFFFN